jgi:hypothetical protein
MNETTFRAHVELERRKRASEPLEVFYQEYLAHSVLRQIAEFESDREGLLQCEQWERDHASLLASSRFSAYVRQQETYWETEAGQAERKQVEELCCG